MKWLKLDCDFRNDLKVKAIMRSWGGCEGAGFWTLLLGFVGAYGGPECRVRIDDRTAISRRSTADWFSITPRSLDDRLTIAARLGLIDERAWVDDQTIHIPKMLKRVDDYSRKVRTKSGHTPDKVQNYHPPEEEVEVDIEEEVDKPLNLLLVAFDDRWQKYPNKDGRKDAERHWKASIKTEADLADFDQAFGRYLEHLRVTGYPPKNGKTFFNNWRDFVDWVEPELFKANGNGNGHKEPDSTKHGEFDRYVRKPKQL